MARITLYPLNFVDISDWRFAEVSAYWRGGVSASQFGFFKMSDWCDARKRASHLTRTPHSTNRSGGLITVFDNFL
jgi:hypothetical protein